MKTFSLICSMRRTLKGSPQMSAGNVALPQTLLKQMVLKLMPEFCSVGEMSC